MMPATEARTGKSGIASTGDSNTSTCVSVRAHDRSIAAGGDITAETIEIRSGDTIGTVHLHLQLPADLAAPIQELLRMAFIALRTPAASPKRRAA